jgi:hypothetical protein
LVGWLVVIYSFKTRCKEITHQEEIAGPDTSRRKNLCPTARPRDLVDRALQRPAEHTAHQHSAPQLHQSQPLQFTADLRPGSRVSSGTSTLAADQRPLHYTAALFFACSQLPWGKPSNIRRTVRLRQ